jgi:hypothetical protein
VHERTVHTPGLKRKSPAPPDDDGDYDDGAARAQQRRRSRSVSAYSTLSVAPRPFSALGARVPSDATATTAASLAPSDESALGRLRRDPSVATLLDMYDADGALGAGAFRAPASPAPTLPQLGRPQRERTGSTLRELLGDDDDAGDISWAEKLLG